MDEEMKAKIDKKQVDQFVDELTHQLGVLEEHILKLNDRLSPVTRSETKGNTKELEELAALVPLASFLRDQCTRVSDLTRGIDDLLDRLEL